MTEADIVVLGGGPAGLAAALHSARAGARVVLLEAGPQTGGLCRTIGRDGFRYDLGGHIPFIRDAARLEWMRDLLGEDMRWVPLPVASVRDGRVRPGRYLDQRPPGAAPGLPAAVPAGATAAQVLDAAYGRAFVDLEMRPYLEKIDGLPLESVPGGRPLRLSRDQAAPDGFWFPREGIGALMDAMCEAAERHGARIATGSPATALRVDGGRVRAVEYDGPAGSGTLTAPRLVVAVPAGRAAALLPGYAPVPVRMRAVCLVFLAVTGGPATSEAWVQVDDPAVPFARAMDVAQWSARMVPAGHTVMGLECYCRADATDPVWSLGDGALADACATALVDALGWVDDRRRIRALEVVRLPTAYPEQDVAQIAAMTAAADALSAVEGIWLAPGSEVIAAVEAGERAAQAALAGGAAGALRSPA